MRLSAEEERVRRKIDAWQRARAPLASQVFDWATAPLDWATQRAAPEALARAEEAVREVLSALSDASEWTYEASDLLEKARAEHGLDASEVPDLRRYPLRKLDPLARSFFRQNMLLAALEGAGTGLGGALLIAADVPLLFTIGFRLVQQIGAAYGFPMRGPAARPLVISVFNVAASARREAKAGALREVRAAAAAFAGGAPYRGSPAGTVRDQSRGLPREIAKNLARRKLGQALPVAGAAVGAGVNYWFMRQTGEAAFMLFRALYLEWKERQ